MKRIARALTRHGAELVFLAGAAAVAVGVGMIFLPAGLITGGVLAIVGSVVSMAGGGEEK